MFLLVPTHPGSPGQRAIKKVVVCFSYTIHVFENITFGHK